MISLILSLSEYRWSGGYSVQVHVSLSTTTNHREKSNGEIEWITRLEDTFCRMFITPSLLVFFHIHSFLLLAVGLVYELKSGMKMNHAYYCTTSQFKTRISSPSPSSLISSPFQFYREARRLALKKTHPDLEVKMSASLTKLARPKSAPASPFSSRPGSPDGSDEESDTEGQEEAERKAWFS